MKAAVCEAFGKPLVLSEVPAPSPGDTVGVPLRFAADHGIAPLVERHPLKNANEILGKLREGKVRLRAVLTP